MSSPAYSSPVERATSRADDLELMNADLEHLRDRLTIEHLLAFARSIDPHARPISFERDWWDGSATSACLLVEFPGRRQRVVSTGAGTPMLLPAWPVSARRALNRRRRASSEPLPAGSAAPSDHVVLTARPVSTLRRLGIDSSAAPGQASLFSALADLEPTAPQPPPPRSASPEERRTVVQDGDYVVCRYADCGGLLPIDGGVDDDLGACPSCGRH